VDERWRWLHRKHLIHTAQQRKKREDSAKRQFALHSLATREGEIKPVPQLVAEGEVKPVEEGQRAVFIKQDIFP
jgi:hypothetical protein